MAIAEILTGAELAKIAASVFVKKGADAGGKAALALLERWRSGTVPENHTIAKATHKAFLLSMQAIVVASDSACTSARDRTIHAKIRDFVESAAMIDWASKAMSEAAEVLEQQVRQIYGQQSDALSEVATSSIIELVENRTGEKLTDSLQAVFRSGHGTVPGWAALFELFFAEEVKGNSELYRILTFDRLNELANAADEMIRLTNDRADELKLLHSHVEQGIAAILQAVEFATPLPSGIWTLAEHSARERNFRKYLHSGKLPYFSRAQFVLETGNDPGFSERELVDFMKEMASSALVLHGPGGVGKTRLATEIARTLTADGWDAFVLDKSVDSGSIDSLVRRMDSTRPVVLLLDYGEAAAHAAAISLTVESLGRSRQAPVALVVTCRSSAVTQVKLATDVLLPRLINLQTEYGPADTFNRWLIDHILGTRPSMPDPAAIAEVCHDVPVLAAFAVYLHASDSDRFNEQFGGLVGLEGFEAWIEKRSEVLQRTSGATARQIAEVAVCLPLSRDTRNALVDRGGPISLLLSTLQEDSWIEEVGDEFFAAHDVLADGLAANWFFAVEGNETQRCRDAVRYASSVQDTVGSIEALNRLAAHDRFSAIRGAGIVQEISRLPGNQLLFCLAPLLSGRLLDRASKIDLLRDHPLLQSFVSEQRRFHIPLSLLCQDIGDSRRDQSSEISDLEQQTALLLPIVDAALLLPQSSNILVRRAYHMDAQRYRDGILRAVSEYPTTMQTHFLLVEMLRSGESPVNLRVFIGRWLERNAQTWEASFVYSNWIKAGGELDEIQSYLIQWIQYNGMSDDASHVYKAWLDGNGKDDQILDAILRWIEFHHMKTNAGYVFESWINAEKSFDIIRNFILRWISFHGHTNNASYIYRSWQRAGGPHSEISHPLFNWIVDNISSISAMYGITVWLDSAGDLNVIDPHIKKWLSRYESIPAASHVYCAWLVSEGSVDDISPYLLRWISVNGALTEARFVYKHWLDAGGDPSMLLPRLVDWLDTHGHDIGAEYIYTSWLNAGGELNLIYPYFGVWIDKSSRNEEFVHISKNLSRRPDLTLDLATAIIRWCSIFPENEDTLDRLSRCLHIVSEEPIDAWITQGMLYCIEHVFSVRSKFSDMGALQSWMICLSIGRMWMINRNPHAVARTASAIFRSGAMFRPIDGVDILPYMQTSHFVIAFLIRLSLYYGELNVSSDRRVLRGFANWFLTNAEHTVEAEAVLRNLNSMFPSDVWMQA